jgi:Domain of unknown function (DUF4290)
MKSDKKAPIEMSYNTQLEELIIPEYGRNVQQLVRYAQKIPNREYRQAFCEEIVSLIQQLYPQSKNVEDYREKLWKHLFRIANYQLEATTPSGITPTPEDARKRPERVPYPAQDTRFRHYGNNVRALIKKAIEMEDGAIKDGFVQTIGSYMKLAYKTWNREHYVSDDLIKGDLESLSGGKLSLEEHSRIDNLHLASRAKSKENDRDRDRNRGGRDNNRRDIRGSGGGRDSRDIRDRDNRDRDNRDRDNRGSNNNRNKKRK